MIKKYFAALALIAITFHSAQAGIAARAMRALTRVQPSIATRIMPSRFISRLETARTAIRAPVFARTIQTDVKSAAKKTHTFFTPLRNFSTSYQPQKTRFNAKPMLRNDLITPALIVAGVLGIGTCIYCMLQPESDMAVMKSAYQALDSAKTTATLVGGISGLGTLLDVDNLSEEQLLDISRNLDLEKYTAAEYVGDFNRAIHNLAYHLPDLRARVSKDILQQQPNIKSQEEINRDEMSVIIRKIDAITDILYNRRHLLTCHEEYFNLKRVELIATRRYHSLLNKQYPAMQQDVRIFINDTYRNHQFPILSFIDQLNADINATFNALQSYRTYPVVKESVVKINITLNSMKNATLASEDYQQALRDKRNWEMEQQRIVIEREKVHAAQRAAHAAQEQAQAQREQARAARHQARAQERQADELAEQNRLARQQNQNPQVRIDVNIRDAHDQA